MAGQTPTSFAAYALDRASRATNPEHAEWWATEAKVAEAKAAKGKDWTPLWWPIRADI